MSTMTPAPSLPGHLILSTIWDENAQPHLGGHWLAGCTCGGWSHRGTPAQQEAAWKAHLDDDALAGPSRQQLAFALRQACMKLAVATFKGQHSTLADEADRWLKELLQVAKAARP